MKQIFSGLILSIQLFTRLPLNLEIDFDQENLNWAMFFFPLVGALIGAMVSFVLYLVADKSNILAGAIGFFLYLILSGGLHLDGLSDMVDGFLANKDKKTTVNIMQDPNIGAFGVLSLISYSLLKFAIYTSLSKEKLFLIPLSCMMARLGTVNLVYFSKLGPSGGFGKLINDSIERDKKFILLTFILIFFCLFIEVRLIVPILAIALNTVFLNNLSTNKIAGVTGDIYGASTETSDLIFLILGFLVI